MLCTIQSVQVSIIVKVEALPSLLSISCVHSIEPEGFMSNRVLNSPRFIVNETLSSDCIKDSRLHIGRIVGRPSMFNEKSYPFIATVSLSGFNSLKSQDTLSNTKERFADSNSNCIGLFDMR